MARENMLPYRIAKTFIEDHPNVTLKILEECIQASDDLDEQGKLHKLRLDVKAATAEAKGK